MTPSSLSSSSLFFPSSFIQTNRNTCISYTDHHPMKPPSPLPLPSLSLQLSEFQDEKPMPVNSATSSPNSSPRLSFSDDLHQQAPETDAAFNCSHLSSSDPNTDDFNFCQLGHLSELSPADELFSNGIIVPIRRGFVSSEQSAEIMTTKASLIREERTESKSFWRFKRSSSFNCHGENKKIPSSSSPSSAAWQFQSLLRRSNSTGSATSAPNPKIGSHNKKQSPKPNSSSASGLQKPPLNLKSKKSYGNGSSSNGSVLNVPPPYIVKGTTELWGIASFFRNGKHKNASISNTIKKAW